MPESSEQAHRNKADQKFRAWKRMLAFARSGKYLPQVINLNETIVETLQLEERSFPPNTTVQRDLRKKFFQNT